MFGGDIAFPELLRFFLGEEDHLSCALSEPLPHVMLLMLLMAAVFPCRNASDVSCPGIVPRDPCKSRSGLRQDYGDYRLLAGRSRTCALCVSDCTGDRWFGRGGNKLCRVPVKNPWSAVAIFCRLEVLELNSMNLRCLGVALVAIFASAVAMASEPFVMRGEVEAFGWVRGADGSRVRVDGMRFPYVLRRIDASVVQRAGKGRTMDWRERFNPSLSYLLEQPGQRSASVFGASGDSNTTVYQADSGTGYGVLPAANPSSLDDMVILNSGVGKPWQTIGFGFDLTSSPFSTFQVRWIVYDVNVENPSPQNDFSGVLSDFGVNWSQSVPPGTYAVEISVAAAGATMPNNTIYVAQQFRQPTLTGTGAFRSDVSVVYNIAAAPGIGSSENQFWYDSDPLDGNYENTEIEVFEGAFANHLFKITVDTNQTLSDLPPVLMTVPVGTLVSGNFLSLWNVDTNLVRITQSFLVGRGSPVGIIAAETLSPSANPTSIAVRSVSSASVADVERQVQIFDFVNGNWVTLATGLVGTAEVDLTVAYGGTLPLSNFVGPNGELRARLTYRNTSFLVPRGWQMRANVLRWLVTS